MTDAEKISMVKTMMFMNDCDEQEEEAIRAYLHVAGEQILNWRYSYAASRPTEVPQEYEMTQIMSVITGYSQVGAEGQTKHSEGSIERIFRYEDMLAYIHANVPAIVRCI